MNAVLSATLGTEPQITTHAAQLLLQRGVKWAIVVVLCIARTVLPIAQSAPCLRTRFADQLTWPPLYCVYAPVGDVLTLPGKEHFAQTRYSMFKQWLICSMRLYRLLTGGDKS